MKIIYVHGFNSSGNSEKAQLLKSAFPDCNIVSPTLPANPREAMELLKFAITNKPDMTILVGSSLGGLYALYLSLSYDIPCFLINPSLEPHKTLKNKIGLHKRYNSNNEDYEFLEEYLDDLRVISTVTSEAFISEGGKLVSVYVANDDQEIDWTETKFHLSETSKMFKNFDNAGHQFFKFSEVIPDIRSLVEEMKKDYLEKEYVI